MAQETINGITLTYPESPCDIFGPAVIRMQGTANRLQLDISGGGTSFSVTYKNMSAVDISEYLQGTFSALAMGNDIDYTEMVNYSELGQTVNITAKALDVDGTVLAQFDIELFCVWGAHVKESRREGVITWFRNFPLTVTIFAPLNTMSVSVADEGEAIPSTPSLINVTIPTTITDNTFMVRISQQRPGHLMWLDVYTIKTDDTDKGVYLRWVDREGSWRYWLFKAVDETRQAASAYGAWNRIDFNNYDHNYGWQGSSGRRQNFSRNDVLPLCAPLVDQDTFDMLQDLTTSPCVDMFAGGTRTQPKWTAVTVQPGSYTKDLKKPEQDFIFNLLLPETPIQQL